MTRGRLPGSRSAGTAAGGVGNQTGLGFDFYTHVQLTPVVFQIGDQPTVLAFPLNPEGIVARAATDRGIEAG